MTSDNAVASKGSGCRRLRLALIFSLALNALIIGAVGGALLFARHGHGWGWHGRKDFGLYGFARTLPEDRRDVIRTAIKDGWTKLKPLRK
ncbi:MAG: periplasmic heavy metal sensor, partial [Hyphomicrobiaceae bacterium]|nr:periplasmic heavy metal sensor [Hyphomicrobiaceae bacterium]